MKKQLTVLLLATAQIVFAQQNQIAKFFPAAAVNNAADGTSNVQQLVGGYIAPIGEDFGSLSNNGWYSTAETHKKFGFDLSVTVNTIFANSDAKYFAPGTLKGVNYNGTSAGNNKTPTAYGPESEVPLFNYTETTNPNLPIPFTGPGGGNVSKDVPIGSLAVPTLQAGLGLFANTDLKFRYTPAFSLSGTELKNWGVGIKHDIKQHIPGIKMAPFSLSLLLAYSQLTATTDLSGFYTGSGQQGVGETSGYTAQVLISKSVAVITFYGGLGYNNSKTTYSVKGTYAVNKTGDGTPLLKSVNLTDPFKQDFTSNGFRGTAGIRLKFGPVFLNGDYTLVNNKGLMTLGLGATVR